LLPPDMRERLPEDHLAWLVLDIVDQLDRSALRARHPKSGAGRAAYDPDMLLALLIYAYCQGVRSSRQIEQRCITDVAFRVLCAQDIPDHSTIARFRAEHEQAFAHLFTQVARRSGGRPGPVRHRRHRRHEDPGQRLGGREPPPRLAGPRSQFTAGRRRASGRRRRRRARR
jgi:transposase